VVWEFEAAEPGGFVATPWINGDAIFATALHMRGFRLAGRAYAIDPATGRKRWEFDADRTMLPTASAPVLADGRVYFGEGMHANFSCKFRCLDAASGAPLWDFDTTDHIESTPTVIDGVVYFGAGNDGLYALDARTGRRLWQSAGDLHIDASPWVGGGKVIVGSGPSRRYKTLCVTALDARTGRRLWQTPTPLPAWGSPRVADGRVFVGLGNGRLTEGAKPPEVPAGALLCLAEDDGRVLWTVPAADAVFQQPTVAGDRVYFGSRDGHLYAVQARTGELVFKLPMGGPVIAPPAIADGFVYVVTMNGRVRSLRAEDGRERWAFDLALHTHARPLVVAAPRTVGGRLYLATEIQTGATSSAILYCLQE
jgi:outer membrane protein assembly factor BamB